MFRRIVPGLVAVLIAAGVAWGADTTSTLLQLLLMGNGLHPNDWGTQTNANLVKIEAAIAQVSTITLTGGTRTLTNDEARSSALDFVGVLASDATVIVPSRSKMWVIANATSGGHTLQVKTSGGAAANVPPTNQAIHIYWTLGGDMYDVSSDAFAISAVETVLSGVQTTANAALARSGGTMTGAINMGSQAVTSLPAPSGANDAARKAYVDSSVAALVPTGAVMSFNLSSCPTGWLTANGTSGTVDLRGYFVRGLDPGGGIDPDAPRTLASVQAHQLQDHQHNVGNLMNLAGTALYAGGAGLLSPQTQASTNPIAGNHGSETRPSNVALLMCQKS